MFDVEPDGNRRDDRRGCWCPRVGRHRTAQTMRRSKQRDPG